MRHHIKFDLFAVEMRQQFHATDIVIPPRANEARISRESSKTFGGRFGARLHIISSNFTDSVSPAQLLVRAGSGSV
jgi:hypothetical protein